MAKRFRQLILVFLAVAVGVTPLFVVSAVSASPTITEYPIHTYGSNPWGITSGPDGALWFTEHNGNKIGRVGVNGLITEFNIPTPSSYPFGITTGPDGALWFTEASGEKIGRVTTVGAFAEYDIPTQAAEPYKITSGSDGALWFTELGGNKIGRITAAGTITEFNLPVGTYQPIDITSGPDGALWFTEASNKIGRITTSGSITEFQNPTSPGSLWGITTGPDGALWFTEGSYNKVGRITTNGLITEYPLPSSGSYPQLITTGPDGALWFTENQASSIGRITVQGAISEYVTPTPSAHPYDITQGSDGAIWFVEAGGNNIGRLMPDLVPVAPLNLTAPSPTNTSPSLSWSASSGATSYNIYRGGTKIDSTADTTYTDNTAPEGTDTYYVTAVNSSGESAPSNSVDVVVDRTAPTVTGTPDSSPNSSGWYNQDVGITWTSTDPSPSSGTPMQPTSTLASTEGDHTYTSSQSCDPANNCATGSLELKIDKTAPTINYMVAPAPNGGGWNNSAVTVTFTCDDALSGVASCTAPVTVSTEGASQTVTGTATDNAGNTTTVNASISLDTTAPTITASLSQQPNTNGWLNSATTVSYTCADGLSGIALCASPQTESSDGMYTLSGTAADNAGNTSSVLTQVNIDTTAPVLGNIVWSPNPVAQGNNTAFSVSATDNLSGVASVYYTVNGGAPQAMAYDSATSTWQSAGFGGTLPSGLYSISVFAVDQAGNTSPALMDTLVVNANGAISGHAKVLPASTDVLPIAPDADPHHPTDLVVSFGGPQTSNTKTEVYYKVKNNQNEFDVTNTSVNWVVIANDKSYASIMLHGDLVTYINGVMSTVTNVAMRIDVVPNTSNGQDLVTVSIWNPNLNPNTDAPTYHVSEYDEQGSSITL